MTPPSEESIQSTPAAGRVNPKQCAGREGVFEPILPVHATPGDLSGLTELSKMASVMALWELGSRAETREFDNGRVFADYDKSGRLLGIEMLGPTQIAVLDQITMKEPETQKFIPDRCHGKWRWRDRTAPHVVAVGSRGHCWMRHNGRPIILNLRDPPCRDMMGGPIVPIAVSLAAWRI